MTGQQLSPSRHRRPVEPVAVIARTITTRREIAPDAYDCVRVVVIRDGSVLPAGDVPPAPLSIGKAVLVAPHARFGYEPEGAATMTTLYIDTDYLIGHLFWQHLGALPDRDAARDLADQYPTAAQVLRIGEAEAGNLGPLLDELTATTDCPASAYYRVHALLLTVLATITPYLRPVAPDGPSPTRREQVSRLASPRWRTFLPLRPEIDRAAALMRADCSQPWTLRMLASHANLSPEQFGRVFATTYGVRPLIYLSILRAQQMARLIRETTLPISVLYRQVGWHSRGHASAMFRRYMGVTPIEYRKHGPRNARPHGPGLSMRVGNDAHLPGDSTLPSDAITEA